MATCLVFTHVPRDAAEELATCLQVDKVRQTLATCLSDVPHDLGFEAVRLCRRRLWNCEQVSAFLSIALHVVRFDSRSTTDTMQQSFAYLKDLVVLHSCERPPWTSGIFSPQEAQEISDFFMQRYYRNYWLFKHVCCKTRASLDLSIDSIGATQKLPQPQEPSANDYFLSADEVRYIRQQITLSSSPDGQVEALLEGEQSQ